VGVFTDSLENKAFARAAGTGVFKSLEKILFSDSHQFMGARKTSSEQGRIKQVSSA
jgi:hypothetical protein